MESLPTTAHPLRKRRLRRRRSNLGYPLKLASVVMAGAFGAYVLFLFLAKTMRPYLLDHEEGTKIAVMESRLSRQNTINGILQSRIDYLQSAEGMESEARRNGFHRPGETVYLLPRDLSPAPRPPELHAPK